MSNVQGIDFGYGKVPGKVIVDAGYKFVCRYLSHSPGKNLTDTELQDFRDNNLKVVVVWETTEQRSLDGYQAGKDDANYALYLLDGIGLDKQVIYFACDFDFTAGQQDRINDYFKGVIEILGLKYIGVYGGYGVVSRLFDAGLVTYGWQTLAWSHDNWDDRAQLNQTDCTGPHLVGVDCDTNEATNDDFGQF